MDFSIITLESGHRILSTTISVEELCARLSKDERPIADVVVQKAPEGGAWEPGLSQVSYQVIDTDNNSHWFQIPVEQARILALADQFVAVYAYAKDLGVEVSAIEESVNLDLSADIDTNTGLVNEFLDWYRNK